MRVHVNIVVDDEPKTTTIRAGKIETTSDGTSRWLTIHGEGASHWIDIEEDVMQRLVEAWAHPERDI